MLDKIKIVLCQPSHPGNIGAAARAMKNMGLRQLTLVSPAQFPSKEATDRASGADDVLASAVIVNTLEEAISKCHWVFGTSARTREFAWPQLAPVDAARKIVEGALDQQVAIVFGSERAGLSNEQLQQCDFHLSIPTHPEYSSLNLAAAVQVISYEIYQQYLNSLNQETSVPLLGSKASQEVVGGLINHFTEISLALGFMDPQNPQKLLPRVRRLFAKAQLEIEEVNILRGLFKAMLQKL